MYWYIGIGTGVTIARTEANGLFEGKDQSVIARLVDVDDYKEVRTTLNWYLVNVFCVENGTFNRQAKTSLSFHQDNLMILRFFFAMWMLWKIMIIQRFGTQPVAAKLSIFFFCPIRTIQTAQTIWEKNKQSYTRKRQLRKMDKLPDICF